MEITKGKVARAQRCVIYGPEGIGKSTLSSQFPNPVFLDVEQGTHHLDVSRTPTPASFEMIRQITDDLIKDPQGFQTFVIEGADWSERHAVAEVCAKNGIESLGGAEDWGRSYNLLESTWAKWLDSLTELCMGKGVHVVMTAHASMRKFEQPEEIGAFDRWEMKLEKKTRALLKEWSDLLLIASYKTLVVATEKAKIKKGTGGQRVLRTTHHPCWDAKNRHGLPDEVPLQYASIAHIFGSREEPPPPQAPIEPKKEQEPPVAVKPSPENLSMAKNDGIPANLIQLMQKSEVTEADVRQVVAERGYYPEETPITNYTKDFIDGVLVAAWDKVVSAIKNAKEDK